MNERIIIKTKSVNSIMNYINYALSLTTELSSPEQIILNLIGHNSTKKVLKSNI